MGTKILLVISAAKNAQGYDINAPINNKKGEPIFYSLEGVKYPLDAVSASAMMALGLPVPKTSAEVLRNMELLETHTSDWVVDYNQTVFTAESLYKDEKGEWSSGLQIAGWETIDKYNEELYIKNAHIKLNLTQLNKEFFGNYNEKGHARHLHLDGVNLRVGDHSLNDQGLKTLIEFTKIALRAGIEVKSVTNEKGGKYRHEWQTFGRKFVGSDGKEHGFHAPTIKIKAGSAFYALIEQKSSGNWGTVAVPLLKANGTPLTNSKGEQITQAGWGMINSTLYPWANCVPSSWSIESGSGLKSHNRTIDID